MLGQIFHMGAIRLKTAGSSHVIVDFAVELSEAPLLGDVNLKKTGKKPIKTLLFPR